MNQATHELQMAIIEAAVMDKHVYDLGAGNCTRAVSLLNLGASKVTAIEKQVPFSHAEHKRLELLETTFGDYRRVAPEEFECAFVSWPVNHADYDRLALVQRAKTIVYMGSNTNCNACGSPELFGELLFRELLAYQAGFNNTVIVVGDRLADRVRQPTGEEWAALSMRMGHEWYSVEAAEAHAANGTFIDDRRPQPDLFPEYEAQALIHHIFRNYDGGLSE